MNFKSDEVGIIDTIYNNNNLVLKNVHCVEVLSENLLSLRKFADTYRKASRDVPPLILMKLKYFVEDQKQGTLIFLFWLKNVMKG